ncbi:hypothetical protein OESDEN_02867 [Oesophagostomum dentatum]|uniref:Uncharacterized protein n=1 Tax=Oesophagostomum dentatum TaxID=61180 RepID=A0A0B1TI11_OESDE|nr:hypothetical protein OESDEN_02867 [Oesophagostomum dentatum]
MYFYEEGECITNTESALSKPSSFAKEENEKVVYFQNGCLTKLQSQGRFRSNLYLVPTNPRILDSTTTSAETATATESAEKAEETDAPEKESVAPTTAHPEENSKEREEPVEIKSSESTGSGREPSESAEQSSVEASTVSDEISSVPPADITNEKSTEDSTSAEVVDTTTSGQERETDPEEGFEEGEDYSAEEENEDDGRMPPEDRAMEKLSKKGEKAGYIKYKKHPKNFASKTAKLSHKKVQIKEEVSLC